MRKIKAKPRGRSFVSPHDEKRTASFNFRVSPRIKPDGVMISVASAACRGVLEALTEIEIIVESPSVEDLKAIEDQVKAIVLDHFLP